MAQTSDRSSASTTGSGDHSVELTPDRPAAQAARGTRGTRGRVRTYSVGRVAVLELTGQLVDGVEELDRAVRLALAENPRAVVCDLTGVATGTALDGLTLLASCGGYVRDWPAISVAVACPDGRVCQTLRPLPAGGYLTLTGSVRAALSAVLATPAPLVRSLGLEPHPRAARAGRDFVTRALLDWHRITCIPAARLAVSELVTNAIVHAGTDIELSIAAYRDTLRVTVRDHSAAQPVRQVARLAIHGRGLGIVADVSRAWGVLPAADGGKVVWAVLDGPTAGTARASGSPSAEAAS